MAKTIKQSDLKEFLNSSLKAAFKSSEDKNWTIDINSISATIKILDESMASDFFNTIHYDYSPLRDFRKCLSLHTGENLIVNPIKEEKTIIVQVDYTIIE